LYTLNNGTHLTVMYSGFASYRGSDDCTTGWFKIVNDLKSKLEIGPSWRKATADDASEIVLRFAPFLLISLGHIYALGSQILLSLDLFRPSLTPTCRSVR
jgi:hypothetical protein